jgi:hypothetical protein
MCDAGPGGQHQISVAPGRPEGAWAPLQVGARQPPPLSRITACALGRWLPGARGFVLTSVPSEQLSDHLGPQRVFPVGDKQPGGGLVHTALD